MGRRQLAGVGRVDLGRQLVQQVEIVAQDVGGAGQHVHGVALGDVGEQRERFVTDAVASERRVSVRRVGSDAEAERRAQTERLAPAEREQRLRRPRRHRAEAVEAGAAQEVEEHGLRLIVCGVAGQHTVGKRVVARPSQAGLEVRPDGDLDVVHHEVDPERGRCRTRRRGIGAGARPNAVIDVVGGDGATGRDRQHHERGRVGSTRQCAGDGRGRGRERAAGEEFASFVQMFGGWVQRSLSRWRLSG